MGHSKWYLFMVFSEPALNVLKYSVALFFLTSPAFTSKGVKILFYAHNFKFFFMMLLSLET